MYTTGAAHPGMYAPYGNNERAGMLNGLRRPSVPAASQQYGMPGPYLGQHQSSYDYQQGQSHIEMEIARMQLQNIELQKQLLMQAAAAAQQQAQQSNRRDRMNTSPNFGQAQLNQGAMQRDWRSPSPGADGHHVEGARRDALQTLERAQRQRTPSATGVPTEGDFGARGSRLSFGRGADGASLVESARARPRQSASFEPASPVTTMAPSVAMSTPPPPKSISTFATPSPPRPTLVLSKPGEAFPQTSPSPPGKRLGRHVKTDSHSSSSSSTSSNDSEHHSFESAATSVGGNASFEAKQPKLNASAVSFTPSCVVAPPAILSSPPPPRVTPYRALRLAAQGGLAGNGQKGAVATRQPKGPAKEEELEAKNFASRIRRRAISSILRGRNSFVAAEVPEVSGPLSPNAAVFRSE